MDTQKQLLSGEEAQNSECSGIEAPDLIQQDITADERGSGEEKHIVLSSREVSSIKGKETEEREIEVKTGPQNNKIDEEESPNNGNDKTGDIDDRRKLKNADTGNAVNSGNENNAETDSDLKEDSNQTDDSENKKNLSEETTNDGKFDRTENKKKRINGEHNSDVVQDDGKNVGSIDAGQNKDSERRTRFSAEITIQPKAYFQAGTEAVVMMPPSLLSDDVFQNDSRNDCTTSSTLVVDAKPSDSVPPQTFLPLTLFTCFFCPIIGLFAVYKSYSVKEFIKKGDTRKANEASQHARQLGVLTLCIGFLFVLAIIMIAVLVSTLT